MLITMIIISFRRASKCLHKTITGSCLTCEFHKDDDKDSFKEGHYWFHIEVRNTQRNVKATTTMKVNTDLYGNNYVHISIPVLPTILNAFIWRHQHGAYRASSQRTRGKTVTRAAISTHSFWKSPTLGSVKLKQRSGHFTLKILVFFFKSARHSVLQHITARRH